jgi:mono/diheme cytochrome c family protein
MPWTTMKHFKLLMIPIIATLALSFASRVRAGEEQTPEQRQLVMTGARLWPVYCAQCHNARPGSEFSPNQWDAIAMHMRTQSNMPAKDIRAIKEFLKTVR